MIFFKLSDERTFNNINFFKSATKRGIKSKYKNTTKSGTFNVNTVETGNSDTLYTNIHDRSRYVLGEEHIQSCMNKGLSWSGRYCMLVRFTTTYAISVYHH